MDLAGTTRSIILSGPMGSGKSTLGRRLSLAMGLPFVDLDEQVVAEAGVSLDVYWREKGETAFRDLEESVALRMLRQEGPHVIAFGGGTVLRESTRREALQRGWLLTLSAPPSVLAERVGKATIHRPLLHGSSSVEARLSRLIEERAQAYAEAHQVIDTEGDEDAILSMLEGVVAELASKRCLVQPLGAQTHRVDFGSVTTVLDAIATAAPSSIVLVTDSKVGRLQREYLSTILERSALPRTEVTLPSGEEHKSLGSVQAIWDAALGAKCDRDALMIAFGGGVVCDLASFAASTLLRGVRTLLVPTTSLAMIDASIGGKTGFDHALGKNLIGTFHIPFRVAIDANLCGTLPPREYVSGLAESVKIALTHDADLFSFIEANATALRERQMIPLRHVIRESIRLKSEVVARDPKEHGERALLNLGHTVGHAIELAANFRGVLHGEAVAIGTALELAAFSSRDVAERAKALLMALGLPVHLPASVSTSALTFDRDKKRRSDSITMTVVDKLGQGEKKRVALSVLRAAFCS
jgi:shikimate kinase / 3-dehydroquinate synthase